MTIPIAIEAVPRGARRSALAYELWSYRELLRRLAIRNLKVRYQRSLLGFAWALLNPLATILVLVGVFSMIIRIEVQHYWAFLISGYFAWVFVMHTLGSSTAILAEHASILKSVALPPEVLVFSTAGSRVAELVAEVLLAVVVLCVFHHHGVPASLVMLPLLIALLFLMTLGLALPLAGLAVYFRDVQHALPAALTMLVYLSPVFYPSSLVPQRLRTVYLLNPLAGVLSLYHRVLYEGRFPDPLQLLGVTVVSVITFVLGHALFRRYSARIAEIV
jgi:lipopolysaccharide transport system permease protein